LTWPRAFLAVPPGALLVESEIARESPKASREDIARWMGNVPKIYEMLEHGASDSDFHRMATAPASPEERELGETYRHLFSTSPSAQPLRAEVGPDSRLTVVAGQHRARAAQDAGVQLVPVHVAAPNDEVLRLARADLEARARAIRPADVETHRIHDEHWRAERGERDPPTVTQVELARARSER
jgi:hypothetical protein